jgi:ribonuclease HII
VWFEPTAIPPDLLGALDDSKRLSSKKREMLAKEIHRVARVALAATSAVEIDHRGIRTSTLDAMRRAVKRLDLNALVQIDGIDIPAGIDRPCEAVVKGDATVPQIAAASIIAKTCRDRLMIRLAARHPGYCWDKNVGYGTPEHLAALTRLGPTPHHRQSFSPVSQEGLPFRDLTTSRVVVALADSERAAVCLKGIEPRPKGRSAPMPREAK